MDYGRVLFVDDDVLAQWILSEVLDQAGFSVTSVCRAEEAMRLIGSSTDFDVLLIDVVLPDGMTGVDVADFWRLVNPGRPVVYATNLPRSLVGSLGADEAYLQKPCNGSDLLRVLDVALEDAQLHARQSMSARRPVWVH